MPDASTTLRGLIQALGRNMKRSKFRSVCFHCGSKKKFAPDQCDSCGFKPQTKPDLAKSFILSTQFDVGSLQVGRKTSDLDSISTQIASGVPYNFDQREIHEIGRAVAGFMSTTRRDLLIDLVRWLWAPALLMLLFLAIIFSWYAA